MRLLALLAAIFCLNCMGHQSHPVTPPIGTINIPVETLRDYNVSLVDEHDVIHCSGTWISSREILTAAHCVNKDQPFFRVRINPGEESVDSTLDRYDRDMDLARLVVVRDPPKHKFAKIGKEPKVGDPVVSMNNSYRQEDSFMQGYVSGFQKDTEVSGLKHNQDQMWMEVAMPATYGASGGSTIDVNGDLVGVFSWKWANWDGVIYQVRVTDIKEFLGNSTKDTRFTERTIEELE